MRRVYNLKRQEPDERDYRLSLITAELPEAVDLRNKCPPVFDQGKIGSCTAQAGDAAFMVLKDTGVMHSRLFLYYKERELEGNTDTDSGATMRSIGKALSKYGICRETSWPYIECNYNIKPGLLPDQEASRYKINKYVQLDGVNEIKNYIATYKQPVLIGMEVHASFERVGKNGVVPLPNTATEQLLGGHAVLIVGYNDNFRKKPNFFESIVGKLLGSTDTGETGYFIVRNSWGDNWGDNGYFYLPYSFVTKGHAFDAWVIE